MVRNRRRAPFAMPPAERVRMERQAILGRLAALDRAGPLHGVQGNPGDNTPTAERIEQAQEDMVREQHFASRDLLVARLEELARASDKIRDGTFGVCEGCGTPIPAARLQAVPAATDCVPCAEAKEWQAVFRSVRVR